MRRAVLAGVVCLVLVGSRAFSADTVSLPSQLHDPCKIVKADEFEDDWVSCYAILIDQDGNRLRCGWGDSGVAFGERAATLIRTKPGDAEERILLKLLQDALAKTYNPAFDRASDTIPNQLAETDQRWFTQKAVQRFIRELSFRCKNKRQPTYSEI